MCFTRRELKKEKKKRKTVKKKDIKPYGKTPKIPLQKIKRIEYKTPTTK